MNKNELQIFKKLPTGWETTTLGEVLPILYGKGLTKAKRDEDGPYTVYGSSGKVGNHSKAITEKSALIIGRKGSVGEVYYSHFPCWPIDTTYYVEKNEYLNLRFFGYLLKGLMLSKLDKSTAIPGLSRDDYNNVQVAIAPLNEQSLIVAEIEKQFSRLDEAVGNLKRVKANLKRYKASVLKAAVEGKLTEEWRKANPDVEPAGKLLERILAERRKKWEETELAKMKAKGKMPKSNKWKKKYKEPYVPNTRGFPILPRNWCWVSTEQLSSDQERSIQSGPFGSNLLHSEFQKVGKLAIGIDNVQEGYFSIGSENRITKEKYKELEKYSARPEDLLITVMSTIGRTCVVPKNIEPAIITKHVYRITVNKELISPYFLNLTLWGGPIVLKQIQRQIRGQTRPGLNGTIIRQLIIPVPPLSEQKQILNITNQQLSNLDVIFPEIEKAELRGNNLRSSILKKAFSGRLVKQDPKDEPAAVLMERIKQEMLKTSIDSELARKRKPIKRGKKVKSKKKKRSLRDVLIDHPTGLTPEALLKAANYSIDEVDDFYEKLAHIADQIEEKKPLGSKAFKWPNETQIILKLKRQ
jgi:type I restriction enzyme, S subunit